MKIVKRLVILFFALLILLIGAAFAIPYFFKDELLVMLKDEINKTVAAKVDFEDVDLSLFRSFPNLSLKVNKYAVDGIDKFEGIRLAGGESVDFTLDLMSVIKSDSPVKVRSVHFYKPEVNIHVLKNGMANYDITIPADSVVQETPAESADYSNVRIELDEYSITDGNVVYNDKNMDVYLEIKDLDHSGSGNFTIDVYDLDTKTEIQSITVSQSGITYLDKAQATLDAIFNIDQTNSKYTLKDNELLINALQLTGDGFVQLTEGDDINMDLAIRTPQNEFKDLLSMIPNAYIEGYENVKANGKFELAGEIKGTYNAVTEQYPAFHFNIGIDNADIKYPDLPLGITNINASADINSPGSNLDQIVIDVPRFSVQVGQNPFNAVFNLQTPISDPNVKADVDGKIDLEQLAKAFPMEGLEEMNGLITANVKVKAKMSDIDAQRYEAVDMAGSLQVNNMNYKSEGLPGVQIKETKMDFTPQNVVLNNFDGKLGKSDIQANGTIDNILAYFSPEKTMKGDLTVRSSYFDANEWIPEEDTSTPQPSGNSVGPTEEEYEVFDRFDFLLDAAVDEIVYEDYKLTNSVAVGNMTPNRLTVSKLETQIGDSDISANGTIINIFDYLFDNGTLGGDITMNSNLMNLNQFMATTEGAVPESTPTESTENMEPIEIPDNIDMTINANMDKVIYTNMTLTDVKGQLMIADKAVILENTSANTLGGKMNLSGGYDTQDPGNPGFSLKYDLQSLNFQETFKTVNTFQTLAPIGKYIEGQFNSTMILEGKLGKDLMPQLSTINAEGFLQTIDGIIQNFKPLQAIGNTLNVEEFTEKIKLENTKNWFEIKNGLVEIKEFDYNIKDIAMTIGGTHGLDQMMDYKINAQIPREKLEKNPIGAAASQGIDQIRKEASKLGINFEKGKYVNVLVNLTGTMTDPKVKFKLLGMDGEVNFADAVKQQAKDEIDNKKQELKEEVDKKVKDTKDKVQAQIDKTRDSLENIAQQKLKEAKDDAKKELGNKVDSVAQEKLKEAVGEEGKESIENIKDNLNKWNPFNKKKKNDKDGGN